MNFNERKEKFLSEYNALPSDMERFDYIIIKECAPHAITHRPRRTE